MPALADSLPLVVSSLAPELVCEQRISALTAIAGTLPPVHRAGFECRLSDHDDRVDLQQGILSTDGEPSRLVDFLGDAGAPGAAWERVHRFAQRWATPGDVLHDAVSELWLELDMAITAGPRPVPEPSVFAVLDPSRLDRALSGAQAVLQTLLDDEQARSLGPVVTRLHRECSGPARVSHIGLMLGRRSAALRVHISELPLRDLHPYLQRIGWGGDAASTEALARTLLDHGDLLVLCLDIVGELTPSAGLECFFAQRHGLDPRWRTLLERLTTLGLCAPEKAEALLRWPGSVTPIDDHARWPDDLLVQSLIRPPDVLGAIDRRLSHVKLVCPPDAPPAAKAYFGYLPVWGAAREQDAPLRRSRPVRPAPTRAVATSLGVKRLLQMRSQDGWWRDFVNRAGRPGVSHRAADASDEWVTAYVASALASIPLAGAQQAAREALELLLQRWDYVNGWGYHVRVPPDADTTTWVLRLARALGEPMRGRLASGRRLIESLTSPDGGVATYAPSAPTPLARFQGIGGSYAGWCAAHTCVTAAAAMLRLTPAMESYLRSEQHADGSWAGYWWYDDRVRDREGRGGTGRPGCERARGERGSRMVQRPDWRRRRRALGGSRRTFAVCHRARSARDPRRQHGD